MNVIPTAMNMGGNVQDTDRVIINSFFLGLLNEFKHIMMDNEDLNFRALQYNITNIIHSDTELIMSQIEVVENVLKVNHAEVYKSKNDNLNSEKGNGWDNSSGKWRYFEDDKPLTDIWKSANGNWFYLGDNGEMVTDTIIDDNGIFYYVDKYGAMVTNTWKGVAKDSGDEDGKNWFMYFGSDGKAYKSTLEGKPSLKMIKEKIYAFDSNAHMMSGWVNVEGDVSTNSDEAWKVAKHYFGVWNDGAMATGWQYIDIKNSDGSIKPEFFYFDPNGVKQCNIRCRKGQSSYYLGADGRIVDDNIMG